MVRAVTEDDTGIKVLYEPPQHDLSGSPIQIIDILAIHGIGAHPDDTWCKNVDTGEAGLRYINWLSDSEMLPSVVPNARIMRYGYESRWFGENAIRQKVPVVANRFLLALIRERKEFPFRPLIIIAHCFGGLVILKALIEAQNYADESPGIFDSTTGLVFFGTPFRGAEGMKQSEMLEAARREYEEDEVQTEVLHILEPGNEFLQDLVDKFCRTRSQSNKAQVTCFYELKSSDVGAIVGKQVRTRLVVSESSGCLDPSESTDKRSLSRTHFKMNKFGRRGEEDFMTVCDVIRKMVENAPKLVLARSQSHDIQTYYEVPNKIVHHFVSREGFSKEIDNRFTAINIAYPKVLVLHGLGGQGKSQITLEYCRRSRSSYQGIFWINASSEATTVQAFENIAVLLNKARCLTVENSKQKIKLVLDTLEKWNQHWLLIFDNYDWPKEFRNLKAFFPSVGPGGIIITSRNQNLSRFGETLEVPPMAEEEGLKLLFRDPATLLENRAEGIRIVSRLGGLALAVDQAASYIEYRRMEIADFLPAYEAERQKILRYTPNLGWEYSTMQIHGQAEQDKALNAFTTWEMSFQQLILDNAQRKRDTAHFLTLHAFLDYSNIKEDLFRWFWETEEEPPEWLNIFIRPAEDNSEADDSSDDDRSLGETSLQGKQLKDTPSNHDEDGKSSQPNKQIMRKSGTWDSDKFWDLLQRSLQLSLLQVQSVSNPQDQKAEVFSLHPLIRDWLQLRKRARARSYCQEAISIILVSIQSFEGRISTAGQKGVLISHIDACLINDKRFSQGGESFGCNIQTSDSASQFADFYWAQGRWKEAEELVVQVMETRKRVLGPEHPDTLTSMANLAFTWKGSGRHMDALKLIEECMLLQTRILGPNHPYTISSLTTLLKWQVV